MDRARAAHLIPGSLGRNEANQAENLSHGGPGPDVGKANTRHDGDSQNSLQGHRGLRDDTVKGEIAS
jgi:hypothetical protein